MVITLWSCLTAGLFFCCLCVCVFLNHYLLASFWFRKMFITYWLNTFAYLLFRFLACFTFLSTHFCAISHISLLTFSPKYMQKMGRGEPPPSPPPYPNNCVYGFPLLILPNSLIQQRMIAHSRAGTQHSQWFQGENFFFSCVLFSKKKTRKK